MYGNANPFLSTQSSTTNYAPLIGNIEAASKLKADAATNAGAVGNQYLNNGINSIQSGNQQSLNYSQPNINVSNQALNSLSGMTGVGGAAAQQAAYDNFQTNPAYRFNYDESMRALQNAYAGKGKLFSGQAMKELQNRGSGLASQEYNNQVQNQLALLGQTNPFSAQAANQQYTMGRDVAGIQGQQGDNAANAILANANALAEGKLGIGQAQTAQSTLMSDPRSIFGGGQSSPQPSNPWGSALGQAGGSTGGLQEYGTASYSGGGTNGGGGSSQQATQGYSDSLWGNSPTTSSYSNVGSTNTTNPFDPAAAAAAQAAGGASSIVPTDTVDPTAGVDGNPFEEMYSPEDEQFLDNAMYSLESLGIDPNLVNPETGTVGGSGLNAEQLNQFIQDNGYTPDNEYAWNWMLKTLGLLGAA